MNILLNILKAIFGATTYKYRLHFTNKRFKDIEARDFIDAKLRGDTMFNLPIAHITPLENIVSTKGEVGANLYQYQATAKTVVFGRNTEEAKNNFSLHVKSESVEITNIITPIWVNIEYYKRG